MANKIVDVLITEFRANTKGFTSGVKKGIGALKKFAGMTRSVFSSLLGAARTMTIVGGIIGGVLVAIGKKAIDAYNELDSFRLTIQALNTDAEDANRSMERLMNIGMTQPGATVKGMFEGYSQLFSLVKDSDWVIALLKEINNQLAFGSFNNAEGQKRIITNLAQILGAGKLTGDELRETAQLLPRFREGLLKAFGTVDSEELVKQGYTAIDILHGVMEAFADMERAPYSSLTLWTKASDHLWLVMTKIGELLTNKLNPLLQVFISSVQRLQGSGVLNRLVDELMGEIDLNLDLSFENVTKIMARVVAEIRGLPSNLQKVFSEVMHLLGSILLPILHAVFGVITSAYIILETIFRGLSIAGLAFLGDKGIDRANEHIEKLAETIAAQEAGENSLTALQKFVDDLSGPSEGFDTEAYASKLYNELMGAAGITPEDNTIPPKPNDIVPQILGDIEENTKRTADSLDYINDTVLGGGDIAARGVKATELSGLKGGRNNVDSLVARAVDLLTQAVYIGSVDSRRYLP